MFANLLSNAFSLAFIAYKLIKKSKWRQKFEPNIFGAIIDVISIEVQINSHFNG